MILSLIKFVYQRIFIQIFVKKSLFLSIKILGIM